MSTVYRVPSWVCQGCATTIKEVVKTADKDADVKVDWEGKTVEVDTSMSEESVRQALRSTGETIE
ncbi:cation transporter [Lyngbya sp. CCY1209]|uniref:heavy-metal-associated domain-containing protein n=1 Tax=Lyngbya sp. CCY1209 TaxID=2886103 RepID=UPI002D20743D|nr:cation transporter [Lyngbya sp. CCY1209]MEB3885989.1 cation transporter [Lyngbya sp. CCY1209]